MRSLIFIAAALAAPGLFAHDIPADVVVRMYVAPHEQTLRVLVRVPLEGLRDIDIPERSPGVADLAGIQRQLRDAAAVWLANFLDIREGATQLPKGVVSAVQLSLPSDRSFDSFETALAHTLGPRLPPATAIVWTQLLADVLLTYPIRSDEAQFAIRPRLRTLAARVVTTLRFHAPGNPERAFEFAGDPGWIDLDPGWLQAAGRFVRLGFEHILDGIDHLLFLLCLVLPLRKMRPLILVVTAFTVAHSITLIGSAFDLAPSVLWFTPLVETLIAASIVYMGLENIARDTPREHRWVLAFAFGLIHGFGFSFALKETMQFAGRHLLTSLVAFNIGVELGQLAVLAVLVPLLALLFRHVVEVRMGVIIVSALVVHTAWHWMTERFAVLRKYNFEWTAGGVALGLRWVFVLVLVSGVAWWITAPRRRANDPERHPTVSR